MRSTHVLVSSTINPGNHNVYGGESPFNVEERLNETSQTISSLIKCGYSKITIIDNSCQEIPKSWRSQLGDAEYFYVPTNLFQNKGIGEAISLLTFLSKQNLPGDILKISGRYRLSSAINIDWAEYELGFKFSDFSKREIASSRAYCVANDQVLTDLLTNAIRKMYGYSHRVVGLRSLLRIARANMFPEKDNYPYHDPTLSLEWGISQVLRNRILRCFPIEKLGVEGTLASNRTLIHD
jgi:hypothetical protein